MIGDLPPTPGLIALGTIPTVAQLGELPIQCLGNPAHLRPSSVLTSR
jgi:hypothetical protein